MTQKGVTEGMGASLHPLPPGECGMGLEGTWRSWQQGLGCSKGRKRAGAGGAPWSRVQPVAQGDPPPAPGCVCSLCRAAAVALVWANPRLLGTPRARAAPAAPTHLWGTTAGHGTMPGDAPGTPRSVTSPAPGSLGFPSPYLPRGQLSSWDNPSHKHWMQSSPLFIKKGYFNLVYTHINLCRTIY